MFLLDDTSNRGSDAGTDPIANADREFFSDDDQRRQELIKQAKVNAAAPKTFDQPQNKSNPSVTKVNKPQPSTKAGSQKDYPSSRNNSFVQNIPDKKKISKDPKKESKINQAKSLMSKDSPKKDSTDKGSALQAPSKDPRKAAAKIADEKLGLGRKTGHLLFLIWEASALIGSIPFIITGLPGLIMINLLLISPKLAYKITIWILIFIPGVGEAAKAIDEVGLGKVDISISGAEKFIIICTDFIWGMLILLLIVFVITLFCYNVNSSLGTIGAMAADWISGTSFFSEIQGFCKGF